MYPVSCVQCSVDARKICLVDNVVQVLCIHADFLSGGSTCH